MAQPTGYGNLVSFSRTGAGISGAGTTVVGSVYEAEVLTVAQPNLPFLPFAVPNFAPGKKQGETLVWNIATDLTAGGALTNGTPIPFNNFNLRQVGAQLQEYGNAISWDASWDELFSYTYNATLFRQQLANDFAKVVNTQFIGACNNFGSTLYCVASGSFNITPTSGGSTFGAANLGTFHVHEMRRQMEANNVPRFGGQYYIWVLHPSTYEALRRNLEQQASWQNANVRGMDNPIISGAYGVYDGFLFVPSTTMTTSTSSNGGTSFVFGEGAFGIGAALPNLMELRFENDYLTDFGRMKGVAWYSVLSFPTLYTGLLAGVAPRGFRVASTDI